MKPTWLHFGLKQQAPFYNHSSYKLGQELAWMPNITKDTHKHARTRIHKTLQKEISTLLPCCLRSISSQTLLNVHQISPSQLYHEKLSLSHNAVCLSKHLHRSSAELPHAVARVVVNEQRFALPEAPVPRAPSPWTAHHLRRSIILVRVLHALVPAAVVVVVQRLCTLSAVPGAHAGHGAQRAGQIPPRAAAVLLRAAAAISRAGRGLGAQDQKKAHSFPEVQVTAARKSAVFSRVRQV